MERRYLEVEWGPNKANFVFFPLHSWGPLQLIYAFQRRWVPSVHVPISKNGFKKVKDKKIWKITKTNFQKCSPNSVLKVETKLNPFWNPHSIRFKIEDVQSWYTKYLLWFFVIFSKLCAEKPTFLCDWNEN